MQDLRHKIVKVIPKQPYPAGSYRAGMPDTGRMLEAFKDKTRVLIVNPEVKTEADFNGNNPLFKWGYWVKVDEANFELVGEENG